MAWSYDPTQLATSTRDQVRFRIGDTDQNDPLLEDEEIDFVLADCNNDVIRACAQCCNTIVARLSTAVDFKIGPYSESTKSRLDNYKYLATKFSSQVAKTVAPLSKPPTTAPVFGYDMMSDTCCEENDPYE